MHTEAQPSRAIVTLLVAVCSDSYFNEITKKEGESVLPSSSTSFSLEPETVRGGRPQRAPENRGAKEWKIKKEVKEEPKNKKKTY